MSTIPEKEIVAAARAICSYGPVCVVICNLCRDQGERALKAAAAVRTAGSPPA